MSQTESPEPPPQPQDDLKLFDRLVGTWRVSGGATGTITYEWMEGGFFLLQRVELEQYGLHIRGLEIIGHDRPFREATRDEVTSRFYDNTGNTLGCVYELDGEVLTIWAGEKGSPAFYRGTFSPDGDTLAGAWVYPGGGYESTSTRVR